MKNIKTYYHAYNKITLMLYVLAICYMIICKSLITKFWLIAVAVSLLVNIITLVILIIQRYKAKHRKPINTDHSYVSAPMTYESSPEFMAFLNSMSASALDLMFVVDENGDDRKAEFIIEDGKIVAMI